MALFRHLGEEYQRSKSAGVRQEDFTVQVCCITFDENMEKAKRILAQPVQLPPTLSSCGSGCRAARGGKRPIRCTIQSVYATVGAARRLPSSRHKRRRQGGVFLCGATRSKAQPEFNGDC